MKKFLLIVVLFALTGCSFQPQPSATFTPTEIPTIAKPTITSSPTLTPIPTNILIPSPTATLSYPLSAGTPLPKVSQGITAKNISDLRETLDWSVNPQTTFIVSEDHSLMAVSSSEWVKIYDVKTKKLINQINQALNISGFSPDNQYLVSGGTLYNLQGDVVFHVATEKPVSFSADMERVAVVKSCKDTGLIFPACETDVYDVEKKTMINGFPGDNPTLSPDGAYVALEQGKYITFRNVEKGNIGIELNPDNYLMDDPEWKYSLDSSQIILVHSDLYGKQQAYVNILSLADGKVICTIYAPIIRNAWLSQDGSLLATANDKVVDIYEIKTKKVISTYPLISGKEIDGVDNSGNLLYVQQEPVVQPIEVSSGPSFEAIRDLKFGEDSNTLSFKSSDQYCVLKNNAPVECAQMPGFLAEDGNYYTAEANSQKITLYKIVNGSKQEVSSMDWKYVSYDNITGTSLEGYSAGRDFVVLGLTIENKYNKVVTVNMKTQKVQNKWDWYSSYVSYAKMSPDGRYQALRIFGNNENRTQIYWLEGVFDFESGWFVWSGGNQDTYLMELSPDSTKLVEVQSRNNVSLLYYYDYINKQLLDYHEMTKCNVNSVVLNQDNSLMLVGCDGVIQAWDMKKRRMITSWTAFNSPITSLAFSKDTTRIAAGSSSGFIKVWDLGE